LTTTWIRSAFSGSGNASDSANWDNGVPDLVNGAVFNNSGDADCNFDISETVSLYMEDTYYGTLTLQNDLSIGTATDGNRLHKFDPNGYTISLKGDTYINPDYFYGSSSSNSKILIETRDIILKIDNTGATNMLHIPILEINNVEVTLKVTTPPGRLWVELLDMDNAKLGINNSAIFIEIRSGGYLLMDNSYIYSTNSNITWSLWFWGSSNKTLVNDSFIQGAAITYKGSTSTTFTNTSFLIEEFIDLSGGGTITFNGIILDSFDDEPWSFKNWTDPNMEIIFIDSVCKNFQNKIFYSSTGSGNYDSELIFSDGIHKYRTVPNTKLAKHYIQGSLKPRIYPMTKDRMVEIGFFEAIDTTTIIGTLKQIFQDRYTFAFTFYDEILSKCKMLESPMIKYNPAHYKEIRCLLMEVL